MTDDTQYACATTPSEMFRMFVEDLKTADRVVIQRRNAIHDFDASYYPNPELIADLIEAQAAEIERLRGCSMTDDIGDAIDTFRDKVIRNTARAILETNKGEQLQKDVDRLYRLARDLRDNEWDEENAEAFYLHQIANRYSSLLVHLDIIAKDTK